MPKGVKQRHIHPAAMGEEPSQKQVVWKQMVMLKVSHPALLVAPDGEQYWYLIFCFRSISIDTLNFYYENWSAICLWAICYRIILSELFWVNMLQNYFEPIILSELLWANLLQNYVIYIMHSGYHFRWIDISFPDIMLILRDIWIIWMYCPFSHVYNKMATKINCALNYHELVGQRTN